MVEYRDDEGQLCRMVSPQLGETITPAVEKKPSFGPIPSGEVEKTPAGLVRTEEAAVFTPPSSMASVEVLPQNMSAVDSLLSARSIPSATVASMVSSTGKKVSHLLEILKITSPLDHYSSEACVTCRGEISLPLPGKA